MSGISTDIKLQVMTISTRWAGMVFDVMREANYIKKIPYEEARVYVKSWPGLERDILDMATRAIMDHVAAPGLVEGDIAVRTHAAMLTVGVWERSEVRRGQESPGRCTEVLEFLFRRGVSEHRRAAGREAEKDFVHFKNEKMMDMTRALLTTFLKQVESCHTPVGSALDEETIITGGVDVTRRPATP